VQLFVPLPPFHGWWQQWQHLPKGKRQMAVQWQSVGTGSHEVMIPLDDNCRDRWVQGRLGCGE